MMTFSTARGCLLAALFTLSCSDRASDHLERSVSPVINGWPADVSDYPSIVALTTDLTQHAFCTGTLIAPDLVITAAHCVEGWTDVGSMKVAYGFNDTVAALPLFSSVYAVEAHPGYDPGACSEEKTPEEKCFITDDSPWHDVGIVVLKKPISHPTCAPILPPERYSSALAVGSTVRIAGYGQNWVTDPSKLFAADVPIMRATNHEIEVGLDEPDASNACFGDSGGPAYVFDQGSVYVTGVTSRSAHLAECGHGAIYSLPGTYEPWFKQMYTHHVCVRDTGVTCQPGTHGQEFGQCPAMTTWPHDAGSHGDSGAVVDAGQDAGLPDEGRPDAIDDPGCGQAGRSPAVTSWLVSLGVIAVAISLFGRVVMRQQR